VSRRGLLEGGRVGRPGGEQEPGQGAPLGQVGGPQLAGRPGLGGVGAGELPHGVAGVAGQVRLDQGDHQQGDDEHADQQGEMPPHPHPHRRSRLGRSSYPGISGARGSG